MILPKVGETWTGFYHNCTGGGIVKTFKVINIIPIREFMEIEAARLDRDYTVGEGVRHAPMIREKIAAGDYDKYVNVYVVHYSHNQYDNGKSHLILETELFNCWQNLQIAA